MPLSKKKINQINFISVACEFIKKLDPPDHYGNHWTDNPPETWLDRQTDMWDLAYGIEDSIKEQVVNLLDDKEIPVPVSANDQITFAEWLAQREYRRVQYGISAGKWHLEDQHEYFTTKQLYIRFKQDIKK